MGFGTPPAVAPPLEGEFTTWTHKWTHTLPSYYSRNMFIASDGKRVIFPYVTLSPYVYRLRVINLENGELVSDTEIPEMWSEDPVVTSDAEQLLFQILTETGWTRSIAGKYKVARKYGVNALFVWKDGVETCQVTMPNGITSSTMLVMSYDGKHLLMESAGKLVCWEGI